MAEVVLQDAIERELLIRAPLERVFAAIADPEQIVKWFPQRVEGSFEPGRHAIFDFGKYGKFSIFVVTAEPPRYFAYRWVPSPLGFQENVLEHPNTLVEFTLEAIAGGTKLHLKESGFASLPAEYAEKAFTDNSGGWDEELAKLVKLMEGN